MFHYAISVLTLIGLVVNFVSIVILFRKKEQHAFHTFLKVLAFYDSVALACCGISYGLRRTWADFGRRIYPFLAPYIVPLNHIAIVSSVYCTVLISFERYIRICFVCQLKNSRLIENIKYFLIPTVILPILFYLPKFFEIRVTPIKTGKGLNCSKILFFKDGESLLFENQLRETFSEEQIKRLKALGKACTEIKDNSKKNESNPLEEEWTYEPTDLRKNPIYYTLYYVHLNLIFGSVLPFIGLLYFNISTIIVLAKMIQRNPASNCETGLITQALSPSNIRDNEDEEVSRKFSLRTFFGNLKCRIFSSQESVSRLRCPRLRDENLRKERRLTLISLFVVSAFVLCHFWKIIPTIVEASMSTDGLYHEDWPEWVVIVEDISHTMICLNSVINFLFYTIL